MRTETEKKVDDMEKVSVKLTGVASYHHLEADELKAEGDVIEVEARRAAALVQQGIAEPVAQKSKK
jgi:hypothetical protein